MNMFFFLFLLAILVSSVSSSNLPPYDSKNSQKLAQISPWPAASIQTVNVDDFGAKADGRSDDSMAFKKAWEKACHSNSQQSLLLVPKRTYHMKPTNFSGPCKSAVKLQVKGTIKADTNTTLYKKNQKQWILFKKLSNFEVNGGGTIDGNGEVWWSISCKVNNTEPACNNKGAPTALTFFEVKNLRVSNLRIENPQQVHVNFSYCRNVEVSNFTMIAPENSPNTDGFHVGNSRNISMSNSIIKTGDDCISIVTGSENIRATGIVCGPGHGISIGSLGKFGAEDHVSNVVVNGANISGTTNGLRIKTLQGGRGYATNITFMNVVMRNVTNPIIIDQNYCSQVGPCPKQKVAVHVKDVVYENIRGTSASEVAVKFDCSDTVACEGIVLENVTLTGQGGTDTKATCNNVKLKYIGTSISPRCPQLI